MEQNSNLLINKLPSRTWNWLNVNEAQIAWNEAETVDLGCENIAAHAGENKGVVRLHVEGKGDFSRRDVTVDAAEGSAIIVVETFAADHSLNVRTALNVHKGATVRLVQVQNTRPDSLVYTDVQAACAENGRFELIQIYVGEGDMYSDNRVELEGDGSSFKSDVGYLAQRNQKLDMNMVVNHYGKNTECEIDASGALKDQAEKVFRGTIDFKKGASGSVGNEKETVLMLGDKVVNKTVPLILCAEENVVGNHGATIGDLDEDTLFYFESRGIDRAQAEDILARAAIERLVRAVGDDETARQIIDELDEEL